MNTGKWIIPCTIGIMVMAGCGKPDVGIQNGKLTPCPNSPNCVSSYATDASHYVDPLAYSGSRENARQALLSILDTMPRVKVVKITDDYIHAEFTSKIFHFTDDVEFLFPVESPVIQVRSASRVGYGDMGVNRKRIQEIRKRFDEKAGPDPNKK